MKRVRFTPVDEFAILHSGAGTSVRAGHLVARVRGTGPMAFLHAVTTQDVAGLTPGSGALACVLDETGHVLAEFRILALEDGSALIDAEDAARSAVHERLARVAPLAGCEVVDESDEWRVFAVRGPRAATALGIADPPDAEHSYVVRDDALALRVDWGLAGFDVLARAGSDPTWDAPAISDEAFEAARIAAGRPRFGVDITPDLIVNETPLLARAVSLTKGCYPGQESVAKITNLGRARRALVALSLPEPVVAGTPVVAEDVEVGWITSSAAIPGGAAAIAVVRTETLALAAVEVGGHKAALRAL